MILTDAGFRVEVLCLPDTPRDSLDKAAGALYALFGAREKEFGFGPNVIVDYPQVTGPDTGFLADPVAHIAARVEALGRDGPIARVVLLTTYGDLLLSPLTGAGYRAERIDMPAGPDQTFAFTLYRDSGAGRCLYLEAVNEADEKIRPSFVIRLLDGTGRLCGGACGAVHGTHAYLSILTLIPGLPAGTGTTLAREVLAILRGQGVRAVDLGTQTAGRFYEKLGFRVTHRLVRGLRTRVAADGRQIDDDLVMLRATL
ncbi:MAG: hypothetical protein R3D61_00925 [Defluviimonas denitrificans]